MKRFLALLLFLVALGGCAFAQTAAATKKLLVGVTMPTADHGWMGGANWWAKKAMDDWKKKDGHVEFLFKTSGDVTKQVADIEDMLVQGANGLVVFPFESAPVTPVIERAHEKGVYIVVLDRGVTKPVFDVYLSNDDESYARQGMEYVCKALGGTGNVVLIEGLPSVINELRTKTAKTVAAKYPGIKILDSQPGNWNKEKATSVMENYLAKYKTIDAVYTADDDMLEGALQAYQESGRKDLKIAFGGAAKKEIVKRIMDGDRMVRADATYPPDVVATGVSVAVVGLRGRVYEGFYQKKLPLRMILPSEIITKDNAKDYYQPNAAF